MRYFTIFRFAVCLSAVILLAPSGTVNADLVGFWDFNDESADDSSGNENHGEINGLDFSDEVPFGEGLALDVFGGGTVRVPHSESLGMADTMTVAYWMKAENLDQPSDWNGPMGKISDPREDGGWEMQRFGAESRIDIRIDTNEAANSVVGSLTGTFDDEWVHVAWTVDEGEWAAFLDGELLNAGAYAHGDGFANEQDLFFGNRANCCDYIGLLDEIGIWDNVLSDEEIADLADGKSPIGGTDLGDFNGNGELDIDDVSALIVEINGDMRSEFDVNSDGAVDTKDLDFWVKDLKKTWIGDADLNGEFDSSDFVTAFQFGQYEDAVDGNSNWESGDWNGNLDFASDDFVAAFQDGGYEEGPVQPAQAVPEPSSIVLLASALIGIALRGRRRR